MKTLLITLSLLLMASPLSLSAKKGALKEAKKACRDAFRSCVKDKSKRHSCRQTRSECLMSARSTGKEFRLDKFKEKGITAEKKEKVLKKWDEQITHKKDKIKQIESEIADIEKKKSELMAIAPKERAGASVSEE